MDNKTGFVYSPIARRRLCRDSAPRKSDSKAIEGAAPLEESAGEDVERLVDIARVGRDTPRGRRSDRESPRAIAPDRFG